MGVLVESMKLNQKLIFASLFVAQIFGKNYLVKSPSKTYLVETHKKGSNSDDYTLRTCRPDLGCGCFTSESTVETLSGLKKMSELVLGDSVSTIIEGGKKSFTKFLGWLDKGPDVGYFLQVNSTNGKSLMLTGSHILFITSNGKQVPTYAKDLKLTDKIVSWNNGKIEETGIVSLNYVYSGGYRAPLTYEGTLLVDNIFCSCYASYDHYLSQMVFAPVKAFPYILEDKESQHDDGVRTVVKWIKQFGNVLGARMKMKENENMGIMDFMMILPSKDDL